MKISIKILVALTLLLALYSFIDKEEEPFSLTVEVKNLRNSKGVVQFTLYNKDRTIPDENYENYYRIVKGEIMNGSSSIIFKNIPAGKYAVNILHDENNNSKIDKKFILPVEGIGFSNYQSIGLTKRPNFSKASFELKNNKTISVKVIYF